jgi:hypothetical protein
MSKAENDGKLKEALLKRALGFYCEDVSEEYEAGDGGERMVKRKVNRKFYPPDLGALRELLGKEPVMTEMSDEELESERDRLLAELKEGLNL